MRILLLGGGGYIGSAIAENITERGWELDAPSFNFFNYTNPKSLRFLIGQLRPNAVINSAVFIHNGRADNCEDFKSETMQSNAIFPAVASAICAAFGIPIVQISTGCIFNGDNNGVGFKETDAPHLDINSGAGAYISSKMLAEEALRRYERHYICRIRLPFGEIDNPRNYLSKLLIYPKILEAKNSLSNRRESASAILDLLDKAAPFGTYHVANPGAIYTHEIVAMIKEGVRPFNWSPEYWSIPEFQNLARTPRAECTLNTDKLKSVGIKMTPLEESIRQCITNWKP